MLGGERQLRRSMVRSQLAARGITDRGVLAAMASVPRERFVPDNQRHLAYADRPLSIGLNQTISQPYIVALMAEQAHLSEHSRVLEVGTGSGYAAAIFAEIAYHVWTIERLEKLAREAEQRFAEMDTKNVTVIVGDGALGHPAEAPFDAIIVAAAAPCPPPPLLQQLSEGGLLVIPIGDRAYQDLTVVERTPDGFRDYDAGSCRFVPLVSPKGFDG